VAAGLRSSRWVGLGFALPSLNVVLLDAILAGQVGLAAGILNSSRQAATAAALAVTWVVRCIASDYTQDVREIRWTDKSEAHIAVHNVTPDEVEQVLYARPRLVLKGAEGTEYAFGTTDEGRYLLIVLAESIDGRAYVVTARDMTNAERQVFRRKGR